MASTTRRGRRAATRSPSSSGTGSRAEIAISQAVRRGARAESASARTVLVRAARTAGTKVAATATPSATAVTRPTVDMVSGGAPARPRRPALGVGEQWGGQPADRQPGRRGEQGHDDVLGEQHGGDQARRAADRLEQSDAPDLVGHPASDEHRDAGHGEQAEQPAAGQQGAPLVPHQVVARARGCPARPAACGGSGSEARRAAAGRPGVGVVLGGERRGRGRVGQLQVQDVGELLSRRREAAGIRPGEPDQAGRACRRRGRTRSGYGAAAAVTATPATRNDRPLERDRITGADAERVGEGGLDHHAAVAHPAALGQLGLVEPGRCGVAPLVPVRSPCGRAPSAWSRATGYGPL